MTKKPSPIEALKASLAQLHFQQLHVCGWEECTRLSCVDARAALEDVGAVVALAERVRYLMDEGEEQMRTAAWTTAWNDATKSLRTALAPFRVEDVVGG